MPVNSFLNYAPVSRPCPTCPCRITGWIDRDDPSGKGDYEDNANMPAFGGCTNPCQIICETVVGGIPWNMTGQKVYNDLKHGCYCVNAENPKGCLDYRIRQLCC
jgi:hypothetical protein